MCFDNSIDNCYVTNISDSLTQLTTNTTPENHIPEGKEYILNSQILFQNQ